MTNSPKRVIITGVSGQDGSYMADYLLANTDHLIYGMVRRTAKPDYSNLTAALNNPRFQLVVGDLSDSQSVDNVVRQVKPDYFINLAAQSFVKSSWDIPEMTFDVDAVGVIRCLEAIRKHVPQCRFYNAGSSEEYGDVAYTPQDENHPARARSPYGAAKVAARQIVKVYRESYGLYAVQGLLFNHESERRGEEFVTRKITLGVARIAKSLKDGYNESFLPIKLGNIDAKRDWSHAEDFVDGIWKMVNQDLYRPMWRGGCSKEDLLYHDTQEYVLSSNETHTVREFIERAFAVAGIDGQWAKDADNPVPESERYIGAKDGFGLRTLIEIDPEFYRPAEVDLLLGNSTRARTELGWSPKVSFDELVTRMVKSDLVAVGLGEPV